MHKKDLILYFIIIMVPALISCSYGQAAESIISTNVIQNSEETEEGQIENTPEQVELESSDEVETALEEKSEGEQDQNVSSYTDKSIRIEGTSTIYEDIFTGSINLEVENESGEIGGYIFLSYMEVKMLQGKSYPCENIIKGLINGILDENTGEINGEIRSEIAAEGRECITGPVVFKFSGNVIEDGRLIEGSFKLPSDNILFFLLERAEAL